jgi:hypothetical protein
MKSARDERVGRALSGGVAWWRHVMMSISGVVDHASRNTENTEHEAKQKTREARGPKQATKRTVSPQFSLQLNPQITSPKPRDRSAASYAQTR